MIIRLRLITLMGMMGALLTGLATTGQAGTWTPGCASDGTSLTRWSPAGDDHIDSYSYTPNHVVVEVGTPVELTLTSVTTLIPHNFVLRDPTIGVSLEEDVGAGNSVKVRFTPHHSGTASFFCDKRLWPMPSHRDKGMEGILEVK